MRETGPIQLVPMTPEFLDALVADRREESEHELGISLFADYPDEDERRFLSLRLRQMHEDARFQAWCEHAFVRGGQMIGHGGYDGPPGNNAAQAPDAVEFGYATEAARMLMDLAEERAGVRHFVLAISPTNAPSLAIARKLGFVRTGERIDKERGLEHVFELKRNVKGAGL